MPLRLKFPPPLKILPRMLHGCADLRLAVVSPFVDRRHGTERALAELLERLARTYHCEIHLYANRVEDLSINDSGRALPPGTGGIFWHKVPSVPGPHLLQFFCWLCLNRLWRWGHAFFRATSFDLILSPGINCSDADVIIVHAVFHRLRELAQEKVTPQSPGAGKLSRLHRRAYYAFLTALERRIYTNPKVSLAAVSQRTAALLAGYFQRQEVRVIPNAVDPAQFSSAIRLSRRSAARLRRNFQECDLVLLLIGNDWNNKGLSTILEALPKLADIPLKLLVVGNDDVSSWRPMASRMGVLDRCKWETACTDIIDAYAAADVYVSPSREDSFGMPVAEAMACALPVITSAFAGVSSLLHDGIDGFVLQDSRDAETLAKLLRMLFDQSELRSRVGEAAAKTALEWTWDRNAATVWDLLTEVSAKKHSARVLQG
jgi:UDP-glucose:(heptosyl)LPS alpha-1,3-glucosyltransferase